jgi:hypothetical protein
MLKKDACQAYLFVHQLRQLGDIGRDPPSLATG